MKLWEHQTDIVREMIQIVVPGPRWGSWSAPTGSGKTAAIKATAKLLMEMSGCKGVIIATPKRDIERSFCTATDVSFPWKLKTRRLKVPKKFFQSLRDAGTPSKKVEAFNKYLSSTNDHVLVTTHNQLALYLKRLPDDLKGYYILLDEGHHSGFLTIDLTKIRSFISEAHRRGATIGQYSATPFREDTGSTCPEFAHTNFWSYTALASQGLLPKHLEFQLQVLDDSKRVKGQYMPGDFLRIAQDIVSSKRPTLLHVPPGNRAGYAEEAGAKFVAALVNEGVDPDRILMAIGDKISKKVSNALHKEEKILLDENLGYEHRQYDVIIACGRVMEGSNWPSCSRVISSGVTVSLLRLLQMLGRATRSKEYIKDYPEDWKDTVEYVYFVPAIESKEARRHTMRLMILSAYLEDIELFYDFHNYWTDLVNQFRLPPTDRNHKGGPKRPRRPKPEPTSDEEHTRRLLRGIFDMPQDSKETALQVILSTGLLAGADPSLSDMIDGIERNAKNKKIKVAAATTAILSAAQKDPALDVDLRACTHRALSAAVTGTANPAAIPQCFEDLLYAEFKDLAVKYSHLTVTFTSKVTSNGFKTNLTLKDIKSIATDMAKIRGSVFDLTDLEIVELIILPYKEKYGTHPQVGKGEQDVSNFLMCPRTLGQIDRHLRRSNFRLDLLVAAVPWVRMAPLTHKDIENMFRGKHLGRRKAPPQMHPDLYKHPFALLTARSNRKYQKPNGENIIGIHLALIRGWRGLPGGESLDDFKPKKSLLSRFNPLTSA